MNDCSFFFEMEMTPRTTAPRPVSKGERTRGEIIAAGYRLFVRQGYNATSMRQIAGEVGLSPGAAYNHFSGKESLWRAVLNEHHPFHEIVPALGQAQGETVETLVRDAAARMIEILGRRPDVINLMLVELVEFEGRHVAELFETFFPPLMEFARRLSRSRGLLRAIPLPIILRAFIGLFFSYFMTEMLIGSQLPPELREGAFDHFVDVYLRGILDQ
jgi:AcrR family transcriptional regulator